MKIIDIDTIAGRRITIPGVTRTIKDILATERMTTHLGIVPPGQATAEHAHSGSEEIVYVVQGEGRAKAGEQTGDFKANHLLSIPAGVPHRYNNTGADDLVLFVVYSPPAEVPRE
jgi:mannose-6-phosphate isomerase-like protein (cupin superfamily)